MKNFTKFLKAYEALGEARKAAFMFSPQRVSEYFEREFQANRFQIANNIDQGVEVLLDWFDENFPQTTVDAAHSDSFSYPAFFDMLKKHPELVESNEEVLKGLLCGLKALGLYGTGLESFPTIDEFITEAMKLKVVKVAEAVKILNKIEDPTLKEKIKPVMEWLKARRPYTRRAYMALLQMHEQNPENDAIIRQARACIERV